MPPEPSFALQQPTGVSSHDRMIEDGMCGRPTALICPRLKSVPGPEASTLYRSSKKQLARPAAAALEPQRRDPCKAPPQMECKATGAGLLYRRSTSDATEHNSSNKVASSGRARSAWQRQRGRSSFSPGPGCQLSGCLGHIQLVAAWLVASCTTTEDQQLQT